MFAKHHRKIPWFKKGHGEGSTTSMRRDAPGAAGSHLSLGRSAAISSLAVFMLALATFTAGRASLWAAATSEPCADWGPSSGSYNLHLCITGPASGASLSGNVAVTATGNLSGSAPGIGRMIFLLDGAYLLSEYQSPYSFTLPSSHWLDGVHSLSVEAVMQDGFTSRRVSMPLSFWNGVTAVPDDPLLWHPATGRPADGGAFIVAATGDGASGQSSASSVVKRITELNPNLFLYLGDVYEQGSEAEFLNWYAPSFGALRAITDPTPGNHEYLTPRASPYFDYWNNIPKYYAFDANGWHFISLNSNNKYVSDQPGSPQYAWLRGNLSAVPRGTCTIVYYHHPYFNVGPEGSASWMSSIWKLMADNHVKIVINGHDHDYQRWQALDAKGQPSSSGVTEFVVGSGGHGIEQFVKQDSRVAFSDDQNPAGFGALLLQLGPTGAGFQYISADGTVLDSGVIPCP